MQEIEKNNECRNQPRVPWWIYAIIVVCMLPGLSYPFFLMRIAGDNPIMKFLLWFYPLYVVISGFLAWQCYGRRSVMTWIVLFLLLMSHACFYYLSFVTI